jgi:uncharacterized protein
MNWTIEVGAEQTEAAWDPPAGDDTGAVYVCAHGAGGQMHDRAMLGVSGVVRQRGIGVVRFNFLYKARKSSRPDPMPKLLDCYRAVVTRVRAELKPRLLLLGGRSMGGRTASVLVSEGEPCDALVLLAYPLHPPGQPQKLRVAHLPLIKVPVLCFNGTRDPFCDPALMKQTLAGLGANWHMHWIETGDHSFHVLKSSGRTDQDVLEDAATRTREFVDRL